jgi:hypothetical protein
MQLALSLEPLLHSEDNYLEPDDNRYYQALAQAPASWKQIAEDANFTPLITALKKADDTFDNKDDFVSNYLSLRQNSRRFNPAAGKIIDNFRGTDALKKFDIFAKAYQLRNTWKLEPALIQQINETYGPISWQDPNIHFPLDWRHPESHALYWAIKGLQMVAEKENREIGIHESNTDRMVTHSLQNLFRMGKIYIYTAPVPNYEQTSQQVESDQPRLISRDIFFSPDLRMFKPYNDAVLAIIEKYKDNENTLFTLRSGHPNMLKNAIFLFYQAGHKRQAQKIYDQLRKLYPLDEYKVPLLVFARRRLLEEFETFSIYDAREQIIALLKEAYFKYAIRDDNESFGREKLAQEIYDYYRSEYPEEDRLNLPPFATLRYNALIGFLSDQLYPPLLRQSLLGRIEVERPQLKKQLEKQEQQMLERIKKQGKQ